MAPTLVGSPTLFNSGTSTTSSASVAWPSGVTTGDTLIVAILQASTAASVTLPTGWTSLYTRQSATAVETLSIFGFTLDGSQSSPTVFTYDSSRKNTGIMVAFRGITLTQEGTITPTERGTASTANFSTPSITTSTAGDLLLDLYFLRSSVAAFTVSPDAAVSQAGFSENSTATTAVWLGIEFDYEVQGSAGATTARTVTSISQSVFGVSLTMGLKASGQVVVPGAGASTSAATNAVTAATSVATGTAAATSGASATVAAGSAAVVSPAAAASTSGASNTVLVPTPIQITGTSAPVASGSLAITARSFLTFTTSPATAGGTFFITFPSVALAPSVRQALRQGAGLEFVHPEMTPSTLTPIGSIKGSVAYGPKAFTYSLAEAVLDGAVYTKDPYLRGVLVGLGVFVES